MRERRNYASPPLSQPAAIGISPLGIVVLIVAATGAWTLSRTAFGRDFYAVGDNLAAARQLGVAVNRTRMLAFTLNGMLAACAERAADAGVRAVVLRGEGRTFGVGGDLAASRRTTQGRRRRRRDWKWASAASIRNWT